MADQTRVIAGRNFAVFGADWASGNAMPADTVLFGTSWGGTFANLGYTVDGLHIAMGIERTEVRVDQELDPVMRIASGRDIRFTTSLAEMSAANIKLTSGMGAITTVAAGVARGHDQLDIGSAVTEQFKSVGYDVLNPGDSEVFRFMVWKGLPVGSPTIDITPEDPAQLALEVAAVPDTSSTPTRIVSIRDVIPIV